jgi:membrane-bound metal-dependent hydrolase YbcI (DUF457 family)
VEPVTHALTSLMLARAGQKYLPATGSVMLVIAGVAPDLDYLSYFGGPSAVLHFHRTLLHSLPGAVLLACIVAMIFFMIGREYVDSEIRFLPAFAVCAFGIAAHLALDLAGEVGVRLIWPFRHAWTAYDLAANLDPWILLILALGVLLPELVRLVSEEIGDRKHGARGQRTALVFLLIFLAYFGARAELHRSTIALLNSCEYHGLPPLATGAFPTALSPFRWRAVVSTDNTIEEKEISLAPGSPFDPDRMVTHYKPQASAALDAAQMTETAKKFLTYARFPIATGGPEHNGYRFVLRDLRFPLNDTSPDNVVAVVELSTTLAETQQELLYANTLNR